MSPDDVLPKLFRLSGTNVIPSTIWPEPDEANSSKFPLSQIFHNPDPIISELSALYRGRRSREHSKSTIKLFNGLRDNSTRKSRCNTLHRFWKENPFQLTGWKCAPVIHHQKTPVTWPMAKDPVFWIIHTGYPQTRKSLVEQPDPWAPGARKTTPEPPIPLPEGLLASTIYHLTPELGPYHVTYGYDLIFPLTTVRTKHGLCERGGNF